MSICGIYKIQSVKKPTLCYIGSSFDIQTRLYNHQRSLKLKKHINKKLQSHVNKYGIDDLRFSILLSCEKSSLIKTEQFFIDAYNPYFNVLKFAGSGKGLKHTEQFKLENSKKQKAAIMRRKTNKC